MFWILAILAVALVFWVLTYNRLVSKRQTCRQGWADIDAQLRQRHDLVPNLVKTVQAYADHERSTLDAVIAARNSAVQAKGPGELAAAEDQLSGALKSMFVVVEAYPELKASANFVALQHELADIEDKLAASRRAYNAATADYNGAIESFPAVLFAGASGFSPAEFWELSHNERTVAEIAPSVDFNGGGSGVPLPQLKDRHEV